MFLSISTAASSSWLEIIIKEGNEYVSMRYQSECLALKQYEIPLRKEKKRYVFLAALRAAASSSCPQTRPIPRESSQW